MGVCKGFIVKIVIYFYKKIIIEILFYYNMFINLHGSLYFLVYKNEYYGPSIICKRSKCYVNCLVTIYILVANMI
jgi:hypothetical protein